MRSSSAIERPASSFSSRSASVPATTTPAAAISSISRTLFRMIMSPPTVSDTGWLPRPRRGATSVSDTGRGHSRDVLHALEGVLDLRPDLFDRAVGVQRDETAGDAVVLDDRLRLLVVGAQALGDHLGRIVGAVLLAGALQHPLDRDAVGEVEEEDRVETTPDLGEQLVERLRLRQVAWVSVENEALAGVGLREPLADERDRDLVGHELAVREQRLDLLAELRSRRDRGAE